MFVIDGTCAVLTKRHNSVTLLPFNEIGCFKLRILKLLEIVVKNCVASHWWLPQNFIVNNSICVGHGELTNIVIKCAGAILLNGAACFQVKIIFSTIFNCINQGLCLALIEVVGDWGFVVVLDLDALLSDNLRRMERNVSWWCDVYSRRAFNRLNLILHRGLLLKCRLFRFFWRYVTIPAISFQFHRFKNITSVNH